MIAFQSSEKGFLTFHFQSDGRPRKVSELNFVGFPISLKIIYLSFFQCFETIKLDLDMGVVSQRFRRRMENH